MHDLRLYRVAKRSPTGIDCDLLPRQSVANIRRYDATGSSIVYRQPETAEELAVATDAMHICPSDSIGIDG